MQKTDDIIDMLWSEQQVTIRSEYGEEFTAVLTRPGDFFDIILSDKQEEVGFITLKHEGGGKYSIVNDTKQNPHPTFVNTPGHGIEVKKKYRKRGIGAALLSLGVGIVQRDFRTAGPDIEFTVVASDVTHLGLGCYKHFGFKIKQGMRVNAGYYHVPDRVPDLAVSRKKVSRLQRFKKRISF